MTEFVDGRQLYSDTLWIRAAHALPADPMVQACALAYLSDLGTGFGRVQLPTIGNGGPSIDHALWFHEPIACDDWVLMQLWPWKATPGRGLYRGVMRDRAGAIGGTVAQEHLLRPESMVPPGS
jgi:acyl-CoA thioesterase-2